MKRLYYLTDSADFAGQVAKQLHRIPDFPERRFHVLGKDAASLCDRQLQLAPPWVRRDLLRGVELGAVAGIGAACILVAILWLLLGYPDTALAMLVFACLLGAVSGGALGWSRENVRIRRFRDDIEAGKILLIVDVQASNEAPVRSLLAHLPIQPAGEDRSAVPAFI